MNQNHDHSESRLEDLSKLHAVTTLRESGWSSEQIREELHLTDEEYKEMLAIIQKTNVEAD